MPFYCHWRFEIKPRIFFKYIIKWGEKEEVRLCIVDEEEGTDTFLDLDELKTWITGILFPLMKP